MLYQLSTALHCTALSTALLSCLPNSDDRSRLHIFLHRHCPWAIFIKRPLNLFGFHEALVKFIVKCSTARYFAFDSASSTKCICIIVANRICWDEPLRFDGNSVLPVGEELALDANVTEAEVIRQWLIKFGLTLFYSVYCLSRPSATWLLGCSTTRY